MHKMLHQVQSVGGIVFPQFCRNREIFHMCVGMGHKQDIQLRCHFFGNAHGTVHDAVCLTAEQNLQRRVGGGQFCFQAADMLVVLGLIPFGGTGHRTVPHMIGEGDCIQSQFLCTGDVVCGQSGGLGAGRKAGMDVQIVFRHDNSLFSVIVSQRLPSNIPT